MFVNHHEKAIDKTANHSVNLNMHCGYNTSRVNDGTGKQTAVVKTRLLTGAMTHQGPRSSLAIQPHHRHHKKFTTFAA
jgi:hypothetical protein